MSENDKGPVLSFEDVSLQFEDVVALDHVSFAVQQGEARVVLGAAGSGKTVLLKVALGLMEPDSGRVRLFGEDISHMDERELFDIRARVGILFQEGGLFDSLTIEENVGYPLLNQRVLAHAGKKGRAEIRARVTEALRFVELEQTLDKYPSELSGGMRRRVGIARAVVTEPPLVLYDSPTAGLDPITAATIIALLLKERESRNAAAIMVTQRYQDGYLLANFRYNPHSGQLERAPRNGGGGARAQTVFMVLNGGRLVFEGTQEELGASPDPYVGKFVRR